jgi:hypothetical protein
MDIAVLIATTAVVTELIKKALLKIRIEIKGKAAVALAVIVSAGVTVFETLKMGGAFSFSTLWTFLQVAFGSTIGYAIVTKKSETKSILGARKNEKY